VIAVAPPKSHAFMHLDTFVRYPYVDPADLRP
jgi:arginine deiminase